MNRALRPLIAVSVLLSGSLACVLLDPVPELQKPVVRAPSIVKTKIFPDNTLPLRELPPEFVVPVRLADPGQTYTWAFFQNWTPALGNAGVIDTAIVPGSPSGLDRQDVRIDSSRITRLDEARCHRFEFIVTVAPGRFPHEADPNLSDSVSWWYVPEGADDCGLFEAGALPLVPDGGLDAGDDAGTVQ